MKGRYDFDQAYNGGNSLAFEGDLKANSSQNVMLYSTKIPVTETTKLSVSHKGGIGAAAWVAVATKEDYSEYEWKELTPSADWSTQTFDLGSLAGKTIYAVKMFFDHDTDVKDYKLISANCRLLQTKRNQRLQQKYPFEQNAYKMRKKQKQSSILKG